MVITERAYARAGLIGNPSDGYFGKTISFLIKNYFAEVTLYESPEIEVVPNEKDHRTFKSMQELVDDIRLYDYYGGIRLLKAAIKKFSDYCREKGVALEKKNFTLRYSSTIPRHVGMAGSSAIITAAFRCLMKFYGVDIPRDLLPNYILSAEAEELKIAAGLQDRVIQVFGGMVFMDFNREHMEKAGCGIYESLPLDRLPPLYVAFRTDCAEVSDRAHSNLRARFEAGDEAVVDAMAFWADLAQRAKAVLLGKSGGSLHDLMNANFDKRREIMPISPANLDMVMAARGTGASAKFTGSGGAIVGAYSGEKQYRALEQELGKMNIQVIKPEIA
jgi:glucuronokinase